MTTKILINNGSDNGLLPDGTKPLPEPMLTRDFWHPSQCNFTRNAYDKAKISFEINVLNICITSARGQWVEVFACNTWISITSDTLTWGGATYPCSRFLRSSAIFMKSSHYELDERQQWWTFSSVTSARAKVSWPCVRRYQLHRHIAHRFKKYFRRFWRFISGRPSRNTKFWGIVCWKMAIKCARIFFILKRSDVGRVYRLTTSGGFNQPWNMHGDVIKWKHFPRYWPIVRGIHRSSVDSVYKASDAELWYFLPSAPDQTVEQTIETPVIWDAIALIMTSL